MADIHLRLRPASTEDAEGLRAIYAPYVRDTPISFEVEPPTAADMSRRVEDTLRRWPWLVCVDGEAVRGYAYATAHRGRTAYQWCTEVSAYVAPSTHRRGVGRALYSALLEVLRRQGYVNAYAGIVLPNPASEAFHRAQGFEPVGVYTQIGYKLGGWHDVGWFCRRLQTPPAAPQPPLPFPEVPGADVADALRRAQRLLR